MRPVKKGIDYFPRPTNFYSPNGEGGKILLNLGIIGTGLYDYLLCRIYGGEGYYLLLDDDEIRTIHKDTDVPVQKIEQTIGYLVGRRLLERIDAQGTAYAPPATVLTSVSIQGHFQSVIAERVRKKQSGKPFEVDGRFWILPDSETDARCIKVCHFGVIPRNNADNSAEYVNDSTEKVHKEKKRKENKRKDNMSREAAHVAAPCPRGEHIRRIVEDRKVLTPQAVDAVISFVLDRDAQEHRLVSDPRIKGYVTRVANLGLSPDDQVAVITNAVSNHWINIFDNEDAKRRSGAKPACRAGSFANFEQRKYDYQDLEAKLLAAQDAQINQEGAEPQAADGSGDAEAGPQPITYMEWVDIINGIRQEMSSREITAIDWQETQYARDQLLHYLDGRAMSVDEWRCGKSKIQVIKTG